MIHGLRNDKSGALAKFKIAQKRLRQLGYRHPVIGFSYDSNVKGAHLRSCEKKAIQIGKIIARKNGSNLSKFITSIKKESPSTKIRIIGHSLGADVITHTLSNLKRKPGIVESVYFFGGSIPSNSLNPKKYGKLFQKTTSKKIVNYYSPQDSVLKYAYEQKLTEKPIGYCGSEGKTVPKYVQKMVRPKNHRFASYAATLKSYP
jgi:hypothetical protein